MTSSTSPPRKTSSANLSPLTCAKAKPRSPSSTPSSAEPEPTAKPSAPYSQTAASRTPRIRRFLRSCIDTAPSSTRWTLPAPTPRPRGKASPTCPTPRPSALCSGCPASLRLATASGCYFPIQTEDTEDTGMFIMKTSLSLAGGLALMCCINAVPSRAQIVPLPTPMAANASVADRSKALNALFDDIWQDKLKHSPEYASYLGDKRYNDKLTDYSVQAINASLARGRGYIEKLGMIDTTGLPDQEKLSADLMMRSLIDDQEAAKFNEWEMPVNQFSGFHTDLAQMPNDLPFDTVKDYDDYIARLQKVPTAFSQITTNMQMGIDDGRMPPEYLLEKVLVQVQTLANQKPEESPFALPLKKFPKTVDAAE